MSSRFLALDISKRGIRQPLIMTQDGVVVSGHRRLAAAKLAGFAEVPCVVQHDADDAKMAVEMTLDNAPRKGPFTQLMAHALVLKDIVEPILAARKRHQDPSGLPGYASIAPIIDMMTGGRVTNGTRGEQTFGRVTNGTRVRWEDVVGRLIGMSGRNLRRGLEIYQAALDGDEHAEDLCMKLDQGELTITGAYKAFKASRMPSAARDFVVLRLHGNMRSRVQRAGPRPRPGHRHYATLGLGVRIVGPAPSLNGRIWGSNAKASERTAPAPELPTGLRALEKQSGALEEGGTWVNPSAI